MIGWWGIPAAIAAAYYGFTIAGAVRQLRKRPVPSGYAPPVSILKPVRGRDWRFYDAIRTHALQRYPEFEILFGVRDLSDPAAADILRLQREFPSLSIRLIQVPGTAPNGKVGILKALAAEARYDVMLVNDSDILVEPDYLTRVVAPLADPAVGVVTCLYRASGRTEPARWEALGIATEFAPSVLVAPLVGVDGFALGSTMVFRRQDLERIGGFAAIEDYLADDYQLGARIAGLGLRVYLSEVVVETSLSGDSWTDVWRHQVRWSRTIRVSRTAGYYGYLATQATVWALVSALAGDWTASVAAIAMRLAGGWLVATQILRDRSLVWRWPLMPLRDLFGFAVWVAGLAGSTVEWRGNRIHLTPEGRIRDQECSGSSEESSSSYLAKSSRSDGGAPKR